tara:strand:+ start:363 stop:575 length:213 start_codon:yes stop_codon:yes gene_type:complete
MKTSKVKRGRGRPRKHPVDENVPVRSMVAINSTVGGQFMILKKRYESSLGFELSKSQFMKVLMSNWEKKD